MRRLPFHMSQHQEEIIFQIRVYRAGYLYAECEIRKRIQNWKASSSEGIALGTKVPVWHNEYFCVAAASNEGKITFAMSRQAIIRTGFASAEDAAEIYGVSLNRVKELRKLLRGVKTQASQKRTASAGKRSSVRSAGKAKPAAKRASTSRKASRRAA